jgi:hypothetical protein
MEQKGQETEVVEVIESQDFDVYSSFESIPNQPTVFRD